MTRPEAVHTNATLDAKKKRWVESSAARRRFWSRKGILLADVPLEGGKPHGDVVWYNGQHDDIEDDDAMDVAAALAAELGLPTGNARTRRLEARFEGGELRVTRNYVHDWTIDGEKVVLLAHWDGGKLHGPFEWSVEDQGNFNYPVITLGAFELYPKDFKLPKPHPKKLAVTFEHGKQAAAKGKTKAAKASAPIADFGQKVAKSAIAGYIARGDLARDLGAFFPKAKPATPARGGRASKSWLTSLPASARAAGKALDALVRAKKFPALPQCCDLSSYGFDTVENELEGAADARYVGLSSDGSGNMHLLDTKTGGVVGWEHEGGVFDKRRSFGSLDAWAFAMIRVEAAAQGRIDKAALTQLFGRLGLKAGAFELEL